MSFPEIYRAKMPKGFEQCACELDADQQLRHYCAYDIAQERHSRAVWARALADWLPCDIEWPDRGEGGEGNTCLKQKQVVVMCRNCTARKELLRVADEDEKEERLK